ncbi:MAG: Ldh family oxidoreductase [Candidatus Cloacimonetes bacterium]|nr:Ldh family oxidoreductase [Candidatus Cloacimonadota bacterium]
MYYVTVEKLHKLMIDVFTALKVPPEDARTCADVLIQSDLHGIESHGIARLKMYYDRIKAGIQFPETNIEVISDRKATAVWDGHHGMGHVIASKAMRKAIDKAREYGIGSVAVRNSTHYGIAGYYSLMATKQDMIGINYTNARPSTAPTHGVNPMLGTNPLCFGCPTNLPYPFLYDAATSIAQRGKVEVYNRAGKDVPEGWAINKEGEVCTNTPQLLKDLVEKNAALLPLGGVGELLGGHKGYGLSVIVEILSAALQNGSYLHGLHGWQDGKQVPFRLGHFFLAMDISFYTDPASFKQISGDILKQLQNSQTMPGQERIYVAGEKEYIKTQEVRQKGVAINEKLQENIQSIIKELQLPNPELGF